MIPCNHSVSGRDHFCGRLPVKNGATANDAALDKVFADKEREATDGHDGTWVAHPGLVPVALRAFNRHMPGPNPIARQRDDVNVTAEDLLSVPKGTVTTDGLRSNIRVGVQYLEAWLSGNGCVPLYNLMEDAATAEISRSQIWQWLRYGPMITDGALRGREVEGGLYNELLDKEMTRMENELGAEKFAKTRFKDAARLFTEMSKARQFAGFLTLPAYELID